MKEEHVQNVVIVFSIILILAIGFLLQCRYSSKYSVPDIKKYSVCLKHADKGYCNIQFKDTYDFLVKYNLEIMNK